VNPGDRFVVVLDLRLPDVADYSLVQDLRRRYPAVPLILMTAHSTVDQAQTARQFGVCRVLDKPFDIRSLVAVVDEVYTACAWPVDES